MSSIKLSGRLELAIEAAIKAGEAIMDIYNGVDFEIEFKGDNSPLTKADKKSHQIIESHLEWSNFPILSEEGRKIPYNERKSWKRFWIIDPIDGTKEFIKRNGEFTVNIAFVEDQKPILGVVYAPALRDLYFVQKGIGSFKTKNITSIQDLYKSKFLDLSKSIYPKTYTLVVSKSHMNEQTQRFINDTEKEYGKIATAYFGSSLKICKVAEGSAHCYPRFGPTMEWDTAAAHAIAMFANNGVYEINNKLNLNYNKESLFNPYFIVS